MSLASLFHAPFFPARAPQKRRAFAQPRRETGSQLSAPRPHDGAYAALSGARLLSHTHARAHTPHPQNPEGAYATLGPLYLATFCAISVTLGALSYSLAAVLAEYYLLQQRLRAAPAVRVFLVLVWCGDSVLAMMICAPTLLSPLSL